MLVTADGQRLLGQAKQILEAADGFVASAAGSGDSLTGPLRIGLIPTVAPYILPGLLPELREKLPSLAPQIVEDQTARLLDALRSGALDVAVLALPAGTPGLVEVPVYEEDFVMVVPNDHSLAGRVDLTADVLDALPLLLLDDGHCLRDQTLDLCRSVDAHPLAGDTRATSLATVVQCVGRGTRGDFGPGIGCCRGGSTRGLVDGAFRFAGSRSHDRRRVPLVEWPSRRIPSAGRAGPFGQPDGSSMT